VDLKSEYEDIVVFYNRKLLLYARILCGNNDNAEEILQETLLTGYRYFNGLKDRQKVLPWLKTIAKRIYLRKFRPNTNYDFISADAFAFDGGDLNVADTVADDSVNIEENFERGELCRRILKEIGGLAQKQRDTVLYRYFYDYSVKETAASLKMTGNSVKVSSHIGLEKVKERLKDYFIEGEYIMDCRDAYAYLHQYAKKRITQREKEEVEKHINICKECRDIAGSLEELEKNIKPPQEKEHRNYVAHVQLPEYSLEYVTVFMDVERYREINEKIEEWGGEVPFESIDLKFQGFLAAGFKFVLSDYLSQEILALFGDDGFRWHIEEHERNDFIISYRLTKINKLRNPNEFSIVYLKKERKIKQSIEHPDLMHGYAKNWARRECGGKLGVYLAVPSNAGNLRVKQGDSIIDCGAYKFVCADRHVLYNECVTVNCSFIK
jgi:RNA polymerase sigma-70 factor (ECF subfamily)